VELNQKSKSMMWHNMIEVWLDTLLKYE